jgi:hypothetical protein
VPHVVADVRYLLLRRWAASRAWVVPALAPLVVLTVLRLVVVLGGPRHAWLEGLLGLAAVAAALLFGRARTPRVAAALALVAVAAAAVMAWPDAVALGLGHLHNAVALALWLAWTRARRRDVALTTLLVGGAGLFLMSGILEPWSAAAGAFVGPAAGLDLAGVVDTLAPGLSPALGQRVVLLYAFAQALHYAVWLVLLPQAAEGEHAPPPAGLHHDLGTTGFALAVAGALALPLAGAFAPAAARATYLSLVLFHGWLEVAVIARWAAVREEAPWGP